jgi:hypothetical protein
MNIYLHWSLIIILIIISPFIIVLICYALAKWVECFTTLAQKLIEKWAERR